MKKKAVFLDRDGTIIIDRIYLNDPNEIEYLPKAIAAVKKISEAGFKIFIVTNQSGVPRGLVQEENIHKIHKKITDEFIKNNIPISLDNFYYAPYLPDSNHLMRKPNIGMIELASQKNDLDLDHSWIVGDRMTDVEAGHRSGMNSIFLNGTEKPEDSEFRPPTHICNDLFEAADFIIKS